MHVRLTPLLLATSLVVALSGSAVGEALPPISGAAVSDAGAASFEPFDRQLQRVLQLANRRLALMSAVAAWKWRRHEPVTDPAREQRVVQQAGRLSAAMGLPRAPIEQLFAFQVRLAREQELQLQRRWQAEGYDYSGQPPDLQTVLRPQLDALTLQVLRALYVAAPSLSGVDLQERYGRLAATELTAAGWSSASRAQLLTLLQGLSAPKGPTLERVRAAGVLRIGTTGDYAPFSLETRGVLHGADIELGRSLADVLGVQAMYVQTSWNTLLKDLSAGRFDLAMSGISITAARRQLAGFSTPYYQGGKTVLARCVDAGQFSSLAALDRASVTVLVNAGGTNQQFVQAHLHRAKLRIIADNRAVFPALLARQGDAMITDDIEVELQIRAHPQLCRAMSGTLSSDQKAILLPQEPALRAAVDTWLTGELRTGRPAALIRGQLQTAALNGADARP